MLSSTTYEVRIFVISTEGVTKVVTDAISITTGDIMYVGSYSVHNTMVLMCSRVTCSPIGVSQSLPAKQNLC